MCDGGHFLSAALRKYRKMVSPEQSELDAVVEVTAFPNFESAVNAWNEIKFGTAANRTDAY